MNERHRMLGSMPCSSTTSRGASGMRATDSRVVGQVTVRVPSSSSSIIGRLTWKS